MNNSLKQPDLMSAFAHFVELPDSDRERIKEFFQTWRATCLAKMEYNHFYPMANDCQIKNLAAHYEKLFGLKNNGVFVEIGAFDGQEVSNSAGLADLGWRGVYVEPVAEFALRCRVRHPEPTIDVLTYCIGREETDVIFSVSAWNALSTAHPVMADWLQEQERIYDKITVHQKTINQILQETAIAPEFDLLIIDVEGNEYEALLGFDIAYYRPHVMIIELHDNLADHPMAALHAATRQYIHENNYIPYYIDNVNTIFIRS
ncbi:MAG: FkbM family methyltransferase [Candidatus Symbiobacter sp.]|nr:FkbM family methyltransferase [Candidatus Symbiobacter sp.]